MSATSTDQDTDTFAEYLNQLLRERGILMEVETLRQHVKWCQGGLCCWPEAVEERESDI